MLTKNYLLVVHKKNNKYKEHRNRKINSQLINRLIFQLIPQKIKERDNATVDCLSIYRMDLFDILIFIQL